MNPFEERWSHAVREVTTAAPAGTSSDLASELAFLLRDTSFPGALALLAARESHEPAGQPWLAAMAGAAADDDTLRAAGIDAGTVGHVVHAVFVHGVPPSHLAEPDTARRLALGHAATGLARIGAPVSPADAARVLALLETGEFFDDVGASTAAVLYTVPGLPVALLHDALRSPFRLPRLTLAVARDLRGLAASAPAVVLDLLDGRLDHPPGVLRHTLRWLYGTASARDTFQMIRTLIAPGNETARLALLLYARANGIPLEPAHLDTVYAALAEENLDLGPLLQSGLDSLRTRYSDANLAILLQHLGRRSKTGDRG